jgi:hypothetical protein
LVWWSRLRLGSYGPWDRIRPGFRVVVFSQHWSSRRWSETTSQCTALYSRRLYVESRVTRFGDFSPNGCLFRYFGQFLDNDRSILHIWANVFRGWASISTKSVLGYILGDFFTNSSGHPDSDKMTQNYEAQFLNANVAQWRGTIEVYAWKHRNLFLLNLTFRSYVRTSICYWPM